MSKPTEVIVRMFSERLQKMRRVTSNGLAHDSSVQDGWSSEGGGLQDTTANICWLRAAHVNAIWRQTPLLLMTPNDSLSPVKVVKCAYGGGGKMASRSCCGSDGQADARPACLSPGAAAAHTARHAVHLCWCTAAVIRQVW
jgi:hypothetical protein